MDNQENTLVFTVREDSGKGSARRLRREAKIPSIVYGHGDPLSIAVDEREFYTKFKTISESTLITLKGDNGDAHEVLVKDYQEDSLSGRVLHLDFYEIEAGKVVRTNVVLHVEGNPVGVREGGILEVQLHELEIECLPRDLPESVVVDAGNLDIGDSLHVGDVPAPPGVTFLTPEDYAVCTVVVKRVEEEPEEEEEIGEEALGVMGEEAPEEAEEEESEE